VTDAIDKLIERLRNPKLNEDMCTIPLRYEAVEALRSQQGDKRQDAVIARLGEDKMFAIGYSCATELLTRIGYARANRNRRAMMNDEEFKNF